MKRKVLVLGMMTLMLCLLTACGFKSVTEQQVKEDLIQRAEVQNCYTSEFAPQEEYVLKEYSLIKEQINKEDKEDIVFCNAVIENQYFQVSFQAQLLYNYYEKGGWIMDEISLSEQEVLPLRGPEPQVVVEYINKTELNWGDPKEEFAYYFNGEDSYIENGQLTSGGCEYGGEKQRHMAKILVQYKTPVLELNGYYLMQFRDGKWKFINMADVKAKFMILENWDCDYSQALGTYKWAGSTEYPAGTITIKSITKDEVIYDVVLDGTVEKAWIKIEEGTDLKRGFDSKEGTFAPCYATVSSSAVGTVKLEMNLRYDVERKMWKSEWAGWLTKV